MKRAKPLTNLHHLYHNVAIHGMVGNQRMAYLTILANFTKLLNTEESIKGAYLVPSCLLYL